MELRRSRGLLFSGYRDLWHSHGHAAEAPVHLRLHWYGDHHHPVSARPGPQTQEDLSREFRDVVFEDVGFEKDS